MDAGRAPAYTRHMVDRRKNPREAFVTGWDPYIVSLVSDLPRRERRSAGTGRKLRLGPTRWRTMLLARPPSETP